MGIEPAMKIQKIQKYRKFYFFVTDFMTDSK